MRPIPIPKPFGFPQPLHRELRAGHCNSRCIRHFQGVRQVFHRVAGRKRPLGEILRQHRFHPMTAQHETVSGTLGDGPAITGRATPRSAAHRDRLRQRRGVLEHQHVVKDFHHLPTAHRATMRHVRSHRLQHRADMREDRFARAHHDRQLSARRRLARARHRRIREAIPRPANRAPISRVNGTGEVLVSTTHCPARNPGSTPAITACTACPSGKTGESSSQPPAISSIGAALTPSCVRWSSGSGRLSRASTGLPPRPSGGRTSARPSRQARRSRWS